MKAPGRKTCTLIGLALGLFVFAHHPGLPGPALSRAEGRPPKQIVVLDPGHGGRDAGVVGTTGLTEKDLTLSIARETARRLSAAFNVFLTRDGDDAVPLARRTESANHHRADVLVSIHAGGAFGPSARGLTTFHYGPAPGGGPTAAQPTVPSWEAGEQEPLWNTLWTRHAAGSRALAGLVHERILDRGNFRNRGVHQAPVLVLGGADMPAILVEIGYLTHPGEKAALADPEILSLLAEGISEGIKEYLMSLGR